MYIFALYLKFKLKKKSSKYNINICINIRKVFTVLPCYLVDLTATQAYEESYFFKTCSNQTPPKNASFKILSLRYNVIYILLKGKIE